MTKYINMNALHILFTIICKTVKAYWGVYCYKNETNDIEKGQRKTSVFQ